MIDHTPLIDVLDLAIDERRILEFNYHGHHRVVCPSAHGFNRAGSNELLRGYQIDGTSRTGIPPVWRMFSVADIRQLVITDRTFDEDLPGYRCGDRGMGLIFTELCA